MSKLKPNDLVMCAETGKIPGAGNDPRMLRKLSKEVLYVVTFARYDEKYPEWSCVRIQNEYGNTVGGTWVPERFVKIGSL